MRSRLCAAGLFRPGKHEGVIRDIKSEARVSDRSMAGQVEHWVKLGRVVEAILGNEEIKVLKENLPLVVPILSDGAPRLFPCRVNPASNLASK